MTRRASWRPITTARAAQRRLYHSHSFPSQGPWVRMYARQMRRRGLPHMARLRSTL